MDLTQGAPVSSSSFPCPGVLQSRRCVWCSETQPGRASLSTNFGGRKKRPVLLDLDEHLGSVPQISALVLLLLSFLPHLNHFLLLKVAVSQNLSKYSLHVIFHYFKEISHGLTFYRTAQ